MPNTGDRYNGMVTSADPNYRKGFRDTQGLEPEPRIGLAWDITGNNKTALHASAGIYHNPHVNANGMDAMARNPPAQNTPSIFYTTMDALLVAGAAGAFSNRPSAVFGIERDARTPTSYNYSVGVQRELGWGTVLDVTYAEVHDAQRRDRKSINSVPDGARFLDVNPQNANPQNPTAETGGVSAALRRLSGHHHRVSTTARATTTRCRSSSIAATSAACSSPSPTRSRRLAASPTRTGNRAINFVRPAKRGASSLRIPPSPTTSSDVHLGFAGREPHVGQPCSTGSSTAGSFPADTTFVSGDW